MTKTKKKSAPAHFPKPTKANKAIVANAFNFKSNYIINPSRFTSLLNPSAFSTFNDAISQYLTDFPQAKQYVITFAHGHLFQDTPRHCLVVKKKAGSLHAGHLNLPGGKIEPNELPSDAALRELAEETGYAASQPQLVGAIINGPMDNNESESQSHPKFLVHIFRAIINPGEQLAGQPDEPAYWLPIKHLSTRKFIPNLRFTIPFLAADLIGFIVQDSHWGDWQRGPSLEDNISAQAIITFLPHLTSDAVPPDRRKKQRFTAV